MTDAHDSTAYHGCPREGMGHLYLWNTAWEYAEMGAQEPDVVRRPAYIIDGEGVLVTLYVTADDMALYHLFMFWGAVYGRL